MNNTAIIQEIHKDMTSCQTAMEKIAELLDNLDSAQCTDPNFPPLFVVMFDEYIQLQTETHAIQELFNQIQHRIDQFKQN